MRYPIKQFMLATALLFGAVACGDEDDDIDDSTPQTITALASADARFSTLVAALQSTGLDATLAQEGQFTVFAPTNEAFERLPAGTLASLDAATLRSILQYHVIAGSEVKAAAITDGATPTTVEGSTLRLDLEGSSVIVNGVTQVSIADIDASNGVIHAIDSVLLPIPFPGNAVQAVSAYPRLSTLRDAVVAAELATALSTSPSITVFAPTNPAFAALPAGALDGLLQPASRPALQELLQYHVIADALSSTEIVTASNVRGRGITTVPTLIGTRVKATVTAAGVQVNDANVLFTDIEVSNGVIHVIDKVLSVPGNIVEVATAAGFSTLVAAAVANDLGETLQGNNGGAGFTVFAPTNAAFEALELPNLEGLSGVLLYHVLGSQVDANAALGVAASGTPTATTLSSGAVLNLSVSGGALKLNTDVTVTTTDIIAKNGIIHVIDTVLLPPS